MDSSYRTSVSELGGGRFVLLLVLFVVAIYEFATAGFTAFSVVCILPLVALVVIMAFRFRMFTFWTLIVVNYFLQWKGLNLPIPTSLPNEMLQILLLVLAIIDVQGTHFERTLNMMFYALIIWCSFCLIEVMNDTCGLGINIGSWYQSARLISFQLMYIFLVFTLYISTGKVLLHYLLLWGGMALFAAFWVWKQQKLGFTAAESAWINGPGRSTHIIQGGTLTRYFSFYSDAANFGIGIASTAVAFIIFAITSRVKRLRYFFLIVGLACAWAMFPSGTRTAVACLMAGLLTYIFLSKSVRIAVPFAIAFGLFVFVLAFTNIGQGNQQIRRMRSAFNKDDASANTRKVNQEAISGYMKDAPWGIGMGMNGESVPANNKYARMATVPPDSEYVDIWIRTGIVGLSVFIICIVIMFVGGCRVVLFELESPSLRGIGAGFCCAFVSQQVGGYGNQVLMQFPNGLTFFGGMAIVYVLPFIEKEWMALEAAMLAKQEERRRIKLEKKKAQRV